MSCWGNHRNYNANLFLVPPAQHLHGHAGCRGCRCVCKCVCTCHKCPTRSGTPGCRPKIQICYKNKENENGQPAKRDITWATWQRYLNLRGHPHLNAHPKNVENNPHSSKYWDPDAGEKAAPPYDAAVDKRLFDLKKGDLIFGIPRKNRASSSTGELACFGRNVNFLWPAKDSPLSLLGDFRARGERKAAFEESDTAELTFGFVADHGKVNGKRSHPFRGRVSFTTFWGPQVNNNGKEITLLPLAAPSGTKAKSRPLYLKPGSANKSSDYSDPGAQLRGRKFYWHQKATDDGVPAQHRYDFRQQNGPDVPKNNPPIRIEVLRKDTRFDGEVHFRNLTPCELGALLAALDPSRIFPSTPTDAAQSASSKQYGIKIGKGKPRGLGSVTAKLSVRLLKPAQDRYSAIQPGDPSGSPGQEDHAHCDRHGIFSPAIKPDDPLPLGKAERKTQAEKSSPPTMPENHSSSAATSPIQAYRKWIAKAGPSASSIRFEDLLFIKDLEKLLHLPESESVRRVGTALLQTKSLELLHLPESESVRLYPTQFDMYGWLPGFDCPHGDPGKQSGTSYVDDPSKRPKSMKLARDP